MAKEKNQKEVQLSKRIHDFVPLAGHDCSRHLDCPGWLV
jgi:hypothetical protein